MIDVKKTIFETIKDKFAKLRFLALDNPNAFKSIMYLIVLDDIYDWSNYRDDKLAVLKTLLRLRNNFITCHPDIFTKELTDEQFYVNVNTPLTNYTWKRVWDSPNVSIVLHIVDLKNWELIDGVLYTDAIFENGDLIVNNGIVDIEGVLSKI